MPNKLKGMFGEIFVPVSLDDDTEYHKFKTFFYDESSAHHNSVVNSLSLMKSLKKNMRRTPISNYRTS